VIANTDLEDLAHFCMLYIDPTKIGEFVNILERVKKSFLYGNVINNDGKFQETF
jgi:hypothetical protein